MVLRALVLLLFLPSVLAQSTGRAEAVLALAQAKSAVFVGGYLRHPDLARALHGLLLRGGSVVLLSSAYTYLDPRSYFLGLHLGGAQVYLGRPEEYYLAVDGVPLFRGRGLGANGNVYPIPEGERAAIWRTIGQALAKATPLTATPEDIVRHFWGR